MALSNDLVSELIKVATDEVEVKTETTVYGTIVEQNSKYYVKLDGSDLLTPISTTADVSDGDRVPVMIKNHTAVVTGNVTSPSAKKESVEEIGNRITEAEILIADKVSTKVFDAEKGRIDELVSDNAVIKEKLTANEASIGDLESDNVTIHETLTANQASIDDLTANKLSAKDADLKYATIENLDATNANVHNLEADYGEFKDLTTDKLTAHEASIGDLQANKLSATDAELTYANIDFANIGDAAIETFFAKSGMIENITVESGTITGELVGVTIKGDLIEGGTIVADKLVVKGTDGLYYKLNTDGMSVEAEQTEYNSLNGSVITAKSITATKISVSDLVAFDATIGGFNITDSSIYSGVKSSADNTTRGIYLDKDGQMVFGDASNFVKFYKDTDGSYKLGISASSIKFSTSGKDVETAINNAQTSADNAQSDIDNLEVGGRNLYIGTRDFSGEWNNSDLWTEADEVYNGFTVMSRSTAWNGMSQTLTGTTGEVYTISAWMKANTAGNVQAVIKCSLDDTCNTDASSITLSVTTEWKRYSATFTITSGGSMQGKFEAKSAIGLYICGIKMERGNQPTDWTPSPEDAENDIDILEGSVETHTSEIAALQINQDNIVASVESVEKNITTKVDGVIEDVSTLSKQVEAKMTSEEVQIQIKTAMDEGVDKVCTSTGYTLDSEGLTIEKSGSEMKTQITEDGMTVSKNDEEVLVANSSGVDAVNLHATTYLIIGSNSRLEDWGARTACFWIGYLGINLYTGTKDFSGDTWNNLSLWSTDTETYNGLTVMKRTGSWNGLSQTISVLAGETYTFSAYVKASSSVTAYLQIKCGSAENFATISPTSKLFTLTTDWKRYTVTFSVTESGVVKAGVECNKSGYTTFVCGFKLELGPNATDWSPAPEDS